MSALYRAARTRRNGNVAAAVGADALHVDVMDAHFVPNLSFGPSAVAGVVSDVARR